MTEVEPIVPYASRPMDWAKGRQGQEHKKRLAAGLGPVEPLSVEEDRARGWYRKYIPVEYWTVEFEKKQMTVVHRRRSRVGNWRIMSIDIKPFNGSNAFFPTEI